MVNKLISLDLAKPYSISVGKLPVVMRGIVTQMQEFSEEASQPPIVTYEQARESLIETYKGSINEKAADILLVRGLKRRSETNDSYQFSNDLRVLLRTLTLSEDQIKILLRNVRCPFLIIKAKDGLRNYTEENIRGYFDIYKSCSEDFRYVEVEGTHHVHLTNPERVAPHICQFLSSSARPLSKL